MSKCENVWKMKNIRKKKKKVGNCGGMWWKMRNFAP